MAKDTNELGKKPTWFLFLGANVLIVLGCALTWILYARAADGIAINVSLVWLVTLIFNIVAMALAGVFMWLEAKEIGPKAMHYNKKWLKIYIVAFAFFIASILFNAIFFLGAIGGNSGKLPGDLMKSKWEFAVYFSITAAFTLVSVGLQRYARFKIDLDVYRRKHGQTVEDQKKLLDEANKKVTEKKPEEVKQTPKAPTTATGGLLDQMDK